MKEYLDNDYVLRNVKQTSGNNRVPSGWVEIPEGAEVAVHLNCGKSLGVFFWKDDGETCYFRGNNSWVNCEKIMFKTLQQFKKDWKGMNSVVWEREKQKEAIASEDDYLLTKTPFTYNCLLGCYVEPYVGCSNSGYIVSVSHSNVGDLVFEVEGAEWDYGILAKEVIFYTDDNQPLSFKQYKEMYYGGV